MEQPRVAASSHWGQMEAPSMGPRQHEDLNPGKGGGIATNSKEGIKDTLHINM